MSKKFKYGEEIIKFLEKYGYNKRGESFEQFKDYATVTYMYAIPNGMRPQTPYVEFTVDADNDGFIFGEFFTDGRKGYSTEFDSVEDLEWFISNANYSNVDLTESLTESIDVKIIYWDDTPSDYLEDVTKNDLTDFMEDANVYKIIDITNGKKKTIFLNESKKSAGKTLTESSDDVNWEILTKVPTSLQEYYWNYMQLTDDGWEKIAINDVFKKALKLGKSIAEDDDAKEAYLYLKIGNNKGYKFIIKSLNESDKTLTESKVMGYEEFQELCNENFRYAIMDFHEYKGTYFVIVSADEKATEKFTKILEKNGLECTFYKLTDPHNEYYLCYEIMGV